MSEWDAMSDDELLAQLGDAVAEERSVPDRRRDAARAAFTWRSVDEELAELLHDSALEAGAAVRSSGSVDAGPRMLSFGSGSLTLELEVEGEDLLGEVIGRVGPTTVALQRPGADEVVSEVDDAGFFRLAGVGAGPARLVVVAPEARLVTPWVTL